MYERFLKTMQKTAVGNGEARLLETRPDAAGQPNPQTCIVIQWQQQPPEFYLVVVNFSADQYHCRIPVPLASAGKRWKIKDLLGSMEQDCEAQELIDRGLRLELPPWAGELLHFTKIE
jgi:hypothetical protein